MTQRVQPPARTVPVGLSTASVYPQNTDAAFRYAAELGFDGIELMVWAEPASRSLSDVRSMVRRYGVGVLAVHAPCLLVSQRVWGSDPVAKLERTAAMAADLAASTVVVHPPLRWQRRYADGFAGQVAELESRFGVAIAVENMFPLRVDRLTERFRRIGSGPAVSAFTPSVDPTDAGHAHYTLDLSHTATAGMDACALADRMGHGLIHVHLADGTGAAHDEHLVPGRGSQPCAEICRRLAHGQVVVEVSTQGFRTTTERSATLAASLAFARTHLDRSVASPGGPSVDPLDGLSVDPLDGPSVLPLDGPSVTPMDGSGGAADLGYGGDT